MLKVGLTGGIGSGKSSVAKIFETFGVPVYYADDRAKILMTGNRELIAGIKRIFGEEAYAPDGALNRAFIAERAFGDNPLLKQLEALVHPAVLADVEEWHHTHSSVPYTIREAALLFETGSYKSLHKVITVFAPLELRIKRVMERDRSSREDVEARVAKQMPEEEKLRLADFVIHNDGTHSLVMQAWDIHQQLLTINGANTPKVQTQSG